METLHTTTYYSDVLCDLNHNELKNVIGKAYRAFYLRPSYFIKWLKKMDSLDKFYRLMMAGSNIIHFCFSNKK